MLKFGIGRKIKSQSGNRAEKPRWGSHEDTSSPEHAFLKGQKQELEFESAHCCMTLGQFPHL